MNIVIERSPSPVEAYADGGRRVALSDKLDKYEVLAYLNTHSTNLVIGRPKSGKSSLLQSMFKSKHALKGL
jgi:ribosome biogenesis GTPase A